MGRRRITIKVRGKAFTALMELCKRHDLDPQSFVEKFLIHTFKSIQDDELCRKKFFDNCIVYTLELSFSFPYECEMFEFMLENRRKVRVYVERVPKRYTINRLPFRTLITVILELTEKERQLILKDSLNGQRLEEQYVNIAFKIVKSFVEAFRRITGIYYNIGIVEAPINLEEFQKQINISVLVKRARVESFRIMPVREESLLVIGKSLEADIRNSILDYMAKALNDYQERLQLSYEAFDVSIVYYYKEQWNLSILLSVIAMESAVSYLVFNSRFKDLIMKIRRCKNEQELKEKFKNALSLTKKVSQFLFPLLEELNYSDMISRLRAIMKDLKDVYDLRSRIVHEGYGSSKEEAEKALSVANEFIKIITMVLAESNAI